jgi:polyisoprenyl-phosphate glycosyltransferase
MIMRSDLSSISAVVVVEEDAPSSDHLNRLLDILAAQFDDIEIVLIANAVATPVALRLKELVAAVPDLTCHFSSEKMDTDTARLLGIDHAIGDCVLLTNCSDDETKFIPRMLEPLNEGFDVVVAKPGEPAEKPPFGYRILRGVFVRIMRLLSPVEISHNSSTLRLLTRPAGLYLVSQHNAELLLKAESLGPGFPAQLVPAPYLDGKVRRGPSVSDAVGRGLRALVTTTSAPLRLASMLAVSTGVLSLLYSLYVVIVYFTKPDVQAGWTTISLEISSMMLLFSIILTLISEYVLQIHSRLPARRRYVVMRELRSSQSRRPRRLNLASGHGQLELKPGQDSSLDRPQGFSDQGFSDQGSANHA